MDLREKIESDMKAALKGGDKAKLTALRLIRSAIQYQEIEAKAKLADADVLRVLVSLQKQRKESIQQFQAGGRDDLAAKEKYELDLIESFLPQGLTPEALAEEVKRAIAESGAQGPKDLGKVMKVLMPRVTGRADGKAVNEMVRSLLTPKA